MVRNLVFVGTFLFALAAGTAALRAGTLIGQGSQWRYWPGESAPSEVSEAWAQPEFSDTHWRLGRSPFRYGDGEGGTLINGMRNTYSTYFLRRSFVVPAVSEIEGLELNIDYDDGFVVWINGAEVLRSNAPETITLNAFAPANHESGSFEVFSLDGAIRHLVNGENVIAIQGFNTNLTSSDFMLHPELNFRGLDTMSPTVLAVDPPSGPVGDFRTVRVTFSEPVSGVDAGDLALNSQSALRVSGRGDSYLFTFAPPEPGELTLRWQQDPGIQDLAARPNGFDWQASSEIRVYQLIDEDAPFVKQVFPLPDQRLSQFEAVEILFSEPIAGLDAGDLLVNGVSATEVEGAGAGPYQFTFPIQQAGNLQLEWRADHGIEDSATEPNQLQVGTWRYQVDADVNYSGVVISEIMAGNQSGIFDDERDRVDWIELFNASAEEIDLKGWSLSDDPDDPGKWVFDDQKIGAGEYFIVHASAKDRASLRAGGAPHTNFRLSRAGEFLGLYSPELPRRLVSDLGEQYPVQRNDHSYGRLASGAWSYFASPTPGAPNGRDPILEILPKPRFSAPRGFYDRPFQLSLSSSVEGAVVRYTTDLSEPTLENGMVFEEPINVTRRFTIRAAAFKPGFLPSETVTHSYLYRLSPSRRSLPILSLVTDRDHLFGPQGIMETNPRNTSKRGRAWERPVSVEYFLPDGSTGFQIDCGLRIQGGNYVRGRYDPNGSLPFSKYSYRLYFRGDYGESSLTYPLIPRSPADEYKQIVLRAGMNDHSNPFVVDELVRRLSADMGQVSSQGSLVNLYVNGVYKGYYNPTERIDEDFLDTWQGGAGEYDIIAQFGEVRSGDTVEWERLKSAMNRDLSIASNYEQASQLLNIDNFIDYLILNIYVGTRDWPHNNWRAARERKEGARWRFYVWDAEWSFFNQGGSVGHNTLTSELAVNQDIARFYQSLAQNTGFRTRFADRVHRHFFGAGALTDENVLGRFQELRGEMSAVLRNMANNIATTWIPRRRAIVFEHLAEEGLFLEDNIPSFSEAPGSVQVSTVSLSTGEGEIYYTLDGTDPFEPATASGSRTELVTERTTKYAFVPTDSSLNSDWRRADRDFDASEWLRGSGGVGYDEAQTYRTHIGIDVNDSMNDKNTSVYVRIPFNLRLADLEGMNLMNLRVKYDDGFVAYLNGIRIAEANAPTTLRWNSSASGDHADSAAVNFQTFKVSDHMGRLREGANVLAFQGLNAQLTSSDFLLDALLEVGVVEAGKVAAGARLYQGAISVGEVTEIRARSLANGRWSALSEGVFFPGELSAPIKFSEIMYHPPGGEAFEFLELTNFGPVTLDLSQYSLRGVSFEFPFGSFLDPGTSLVLASDRKPVSFQERYPSVEIWGYFSGSLSNAGESLVLEDPLGRYVTGVFYGDQGVWPEEADGGGYSLELIQPDGDASVPSRWWRSEHLGGSPGWVTSLSTNPSVVISEVMSANRMADGSEAPSLDWVEIENGSRSRISIAGYRLKDESSGDPFVFGPEEMLEPGERRVILRAEAGNNHLGLPFGLNREGDSVVLLDNLGQRLDAVTFGRQVFGYTLGRDSFGEWRLGEPTPGGENRVASTAALSALRINEIVANPVSGEDDWIELHNSDSNLPVSLTGLHIELDGHVHGLAPHSFIEPGGYQVVYSRLSTHREALRFQLPAAGAEIALLDAGGESIDRIRFGPQDEGTSFGRVPDGTGAFQIFTLNTSPGERNLPPISRRVQINELMARNQTVRYFGVQGTPDWIELVNLSSSPVSMEGMRLRFEDGSDWAIPEGIAINGGGFLVIWFDGDDLVRRSALPGLSIPRSLGGQSDRIELVDLNGRTVDQIVYGPQLVDQTIGRVGEDWRVLSKGTPGQLNAIESALGTIGSLRINEWRTGGAGNDWLELYNSDSAPLSLSGLYLTDDPSLAGQTKHQIGPASFVGAKSWVVFQADGRTDRGVNHLNFKLDAQGETLRLYSASLSVLDEVNMSQNLQEPGSTGRLPDGADHILSFAEDEASPAQINRKRIQGLRINELLLHANAPFERAIEVFNSTSLPIDLSGWALGSHRTSLDRFRIADRAIVLPGQFHVIYESDWLDSEGIASEPWPLSSGDRVTLSEVDTAGEFTGRGVSIPVVDTQNGSSFGRIETGEGSQDGRLSQLSFGVSSPATRDAFRQGRGQANAPGWVGAVVVNELYIDGNQEMPNETPLEGLEYIELSNRSDQTVVLSSSSDPTLGWRVRGGVDFTFRGDVVLNSGETLLLVNFDPDTDPLQGESFERELSVPKDVLVLGPFQGRLANEGDRVELQRLYDVAELGDLSGPQLVWLDEDTIEYRDENPWPVSSVETPFVLSRKDLDAFGNDAHDWIAARPSPGVIGDGLPSGAPESLITDILLENGTISLRLTVQPEFRYQVQYAERIEGSEWKLLQRVSEGSGELVVTDSVGSLEGRFYRVIQED